MPAQPLNATQIPSEIQQLMDSWLRGAQTSDVPAIVAHYTPDIVAYDAIQQLQFIGVEAYRKHWVACAEMCGTGPVIFEIHQMKADIGDEAGFGHYLARCGKVDADGKEHASWMRATVGFRKLNGQWRIAHEHFSAPFDMESGKALFDLQP